MYGKKLILPLILLFVFLFLPLNVFAQNQMTVGQNTVILDKDQVVNHDYFAAGKSVTLDGIVNGDVYAAGGQIDINGTVNGDLLVAGGQITIRGNIIQNIRAVGGTIIIRGNVGRNISVAGGNITIDKDAKINGNLVVAGGNTDILSPIKELTVAGGQVKLESVVLGNVTAGVGMLEIMPNTIIQGNLNYWSNNKATFDAGAKVLKSTTFHQTNFNQPVRNGRNNDIFKMPFGMIGFISSLIFGILIIWLFPIYSQRTTEIISKKFWQSLLLGLVSLIVTPIIAILLAVTIIGIPFAILTMAAYILIIYISKLFVALTLGNIVSKKANWKINRIWTFIIGFAIFSIIGIIPILGGITRMIALFTGMGALLIQKQYYFTTLRDKKLI